MARGLLGVAIAVLITLAVAASSAAAANLSAAPAGDGTPPCPIADPCDLATALGAAAAGDVVSALPGTYAVASVTVGAGVTLQGPGSGPPAVIAGDGSGVAAIVASGPEARVRDLTVTQRDFAAGVEIAAGALGDRLAVTASGAGAACSVPIGGLVRNSLCRALGGGNGVLVDEDTAVSGGSRIVNVTAVSSSDEGVGAALLVRSSLGANLDVEATNTIAASLGAAPDIAVGALAGSTADLQLERSNYATLALVGGTASATEPGTGGNQEAEPSFTGASSGDFRQAPDSPTIDAGTAAAAGLGFLDLLRNARIAGPAPDIGAYELQSRAPLPAVRIAGPHGVVKAKGRFVRVSFRLRSQVAGASFRCRLDRSGAQPCSSPVSYRLRARRPQARHVLRVRAVDALGNRSPAAVARFRIVRGGA